MRPILKQHIEHECSDGIKHELCTQVRMIDAEK
jgi:hypothetical protein